MPAVVRPYGVVATLGPSGTSSELAAQYLCTLLGDERPDAVVLHDSYEQAHADVVAGRAVRMVVANAYHRVNTFYMDQRLALESAFVLDTPEYGLAADPSRPVPLHPKVVTHPAPRDLIRQLTPPGYQAGAIVEVGSTSAAAVQVTAGSADLALTTAPAARLHGLRFVSTTRPIRMLWSVFVRAADGAV
ncbi:hypothetical protein [Kibdelosporangium aridum]|uniref:hypothetical protein n=1 Tax=Kibdelosporangium aridum TaxID=2030 RepID=UPI0005273A2C